MTFVIIHKNKCFKPKEAGRYNSQLDGRLHPAPHRRHTSTGRRESRYTSALFAAEDEAGYDLDREEII